jgi:hypothetical protein
MTSDADTPGPSSDPRDPDTARPALVITWAPRGSAAPAVGPGTAVFEALDGSGLAIASKATGAALGSGDTVSYQHRRTDPVETDGLFGDSPYLLAVRLYVPEASQDEVRDWLEEEHIAQQLGVSGTYWYVGYEASSGRFTFLNLWGLRDPGVIETPEWAAARDSPWRMRLLPAFKEMDRAVYRRLGR